MTVINKILTQRKWLVPLLTALFLLLTDAFGVNIEERTFWAIVALVGLAVGAEGLKDAAAAKKVTYKDIIPMIPKESQETLKELAAAFVTGVGKGANKEPDVDNLVNLIFGEALNAKVKEELDKDK